MNADRPGGTVIDGRVVAPDAHAGDTAPGDERRTEDDIATGVRSYLAGLVLATVLTIASFTVAGSQIIRVATAGALSILERVRVRRWRNRARRDSRPRAC